jgi:hypothetical protein
MPAHFIAFDLLQVDGQELLQVPYGERRAQLERLFTDRELSARWTLCPETTDVATAREWLTSWRQVPGPARLGVLSGEVGDAAGWWVAADAGVGSVVVVTVQPVGECCPPFAV